MTTTTATVVSDDLSRVKDLIEYIEKTVTVFREHYLSKNVFYVDGDLPPYKAYLGGEADTVPSLDEGSIVTSEPWPFSENEIIPANTAQYGSLNIGAVIPNTKTVFVRYHDRTYKGYTAHGVVTDEERNMAKARARAAAAAALLETEPVATTPEATAAFVDEAAAAIQDHLARNPSLLDTWIDTQNRRQAGFIVYDASDARWNIARLRSMLEDRVLKPMHWRMIKLKQKHVYDWVPTYQDFLTGDDYTKLRSTSDARLVVVIVDRERQVSEYRVVVIAKLGFHEDQRLQINRKRAESVRTELAKRRKIEQETMEKEEEEEEEEERRTNVTRRTERERKRAAAIKARAATVAAEAAAEEVEAVPPTDVEKEAWLSSMTTTRVQMWKELLSAKTADVKRWARTGRTPMQNTTWDYFLADLTKTVQAKTVPEVRELLTTLTRGWKTGTETPLVRRLAATIPDFASIAASKECSKTLIPLLFSEIFDDLVSNGPRRDGGAVRMIRFYETMYGTPDGIAAALFWDTLSPDALPERRKQQQRWAEAWFDLEDAAMTLVLGSDPLLYGPVLEITHLGNAICYALYTAALLDVGDFAFLDAVWDYASTGKYTELGLAAAGARQLRTYGDEDARDSASFLWSAVQEASAALAAIVVKTGSGARLAAPSGEGEEEDEPFAHSPHCANCGLDAEMACGRCGVVRYCDEICQVNDWRRHAVMCIMYNPDFGR